MQLLAKLKVNSSGGGGAERFQQLTRRSTNTRNVHVPRSKTFTGQKGIEFILEKQHGNEKKIPKKDPPPRPSETAAPWAKHLPLPTRCLPLSQSPRQPRRLPHVTHQMFLFVRSLFHLSSDSGLLTSLDWMVSFDLRGRRRRAVRDDLSPFQSGTLFDLPFRENSVQISWKITQPYGGKKKPNTFSSGYTFFSNCFYCG